MATCLSFDSVAKDFPGVRALDGVSFTAEGGRIHALMGENGAGKSTLLKILSGAYTPTTGALVIDGVRQRFPDTAAALAAGVAVIYQELHLVAGMSVAENLFLGHLPARSGLIDRRQLRADARRALAWVGEEIDPDTPVGHLPIAQRQLVEIAKALTHGARVIAFDEPTSSLSSREVDRLFAVIRDLKARGHVVLYVTHRMDEVFALCDAVTVLRDGRHIRTCDTLAGLAVDDIIRLMVGRDLGNVFNYAPRPLGAPALEIQDFTGPGLSAPVSLSVTQGEIVGLFGLVGAGRSELLRLVYGATTRTGGVLRLAGETVALARPADAIAAGLVYCPEDRKRDGILPVRPVHENINLSARRHHAFGGFILNQAWERTNAATHIATLGVKTASAETAIVHLSGGNQQKVILARWLSEDVKVILLDEPTRGIDVGAKSEIYALVQQLAARGVGVLFVSSELPEVLGLADRILVMRGGALAGEFPRAAATEESVLKAALPAAS
ncbi:Arabinose import ATP-binding protein AraG [Lacunisphaera limnophila]|uniref:Arabinose import ATP-binding protein AraG n=1 Tax=Lacunisphaera limnophila TaxID=1838286 RepID=A0A1D8AUK5_9BACT|nr:L-arabinose ABC transporter ATP-binding protein AraG [Lacunisphaera limnophila]AOS44577.1 Arabinose import ATP-binding protein AraG [Lacunisphaera limnophila]